jgi:hypothetical protein
MLLQEKETFFSVVGFFCRFMDICMSNALEDLWLDLLVDVWICVLTFVWIDVWKLGGLMARDYE